jgi:hypothetical protein
MEDKKARAKGIITDAKKERRRALALRAVILTVMLGALGLSFYAKSIHAEKVALEERYEEENSELLKRESEARAAFEHWRRMYIMSTKLPIKGLDIRKTNGTIYVSGRIRNLSDEGFNDIELTALFEDRDGNILLEKRHVAISADGLPLGKHQSRRFSFKVLEPPTDAVDITVLVTDLEPAGSEIFLVPSLRR